MNGQLQSQGQRATRACKIIKESQPTYGCMRYDEQDAHYSKEELEDGKSNLHLVILVGNGDGSHKFNLKFGGWQFGDWQFFSQEKGNNGCCEQMTI